MRKLRGGIRPSGAPLARVCLRWLIVSLASILFAAEASGQSPPDIGYEIKAVFLFNFAHFVEWPQGAFAGPKAPLIIGILGQDPFGPFLDDAIRGETVNNRPLVVRHYSRAEDAAESQILFISRSEAGRLTEIARTLDDRSILTVCETDEEPEAGIVVRLLNRRNHIRLRIDLDAARSSDLTLSSKILRLADIVRRGGN